MSGYDYSEYLESSGCSYLPHAFKQELWQIFRSGMPGQRNHVFECASISNVIEIRHKPDDGSFQDVYYWENPLQTKLPDSLCIVSQETIATMMLPEEN